MQNSSLMLDVNSMPLLEYMCSLGAPLPCVPMIRCLYMLVITVSSSFSRISTAFVYLENSSTMYIVQYILVPTCFVFWCQFLKVHSQDVKKSMALGRVRCGSNGRFFSGLFLTVLYYLV